ncbi:hypothetical protein NA57DRAFT_64539 [Rhizodiscina lignyota]|uniref:EB1 C-terminal domain-containing protein n=1 Tax=Rhizodiscina lignyota TaxID=1504668 RepID=A0A9P4MDQ4_9PEZI|nr:hypothetical protein NA57DRAFT_64539 [Rhizodiscina lignyota]
MYTDSTGKNVTVSPRLGKGEVQPLFNSAAKFSLLDGSGVSGGNMIANIRCESCNSWSGGSANFKGSAGDWIFAYKAGSPIASNSQSANLDQHDNMGQFSFDYSKANGGSSTNPLAAVASSSGSSTTKCGSNKGTSPSTTSGSSGASSTNGNQPPWASFFSSQFGGSAPTGSPFSGNYKRDTDDDGDSCDDTPETLGAGFSGGGFFSSSRPQQFYKAHGILAALCFVVFLPIGGIIIRVLSFPGLIWLHAAMQIVGYIMFIAAFGLGIYIAKNEELLSSYHPIIGIIVFVLIFFQPMLGMIHHQMFKKYGQRTFWSYGHVWLGRIIITLGIINGGLGLKLAGNTKGGEIAYGVVAGIVWLAYIIAAFVGELKRKRAMADQPPKYTDSPPMTQSGPSNGQMAEGGSPVEYYNQGQENGSQDAYRAALCQVFDSIFLDIPMSRVKFNVNTEYAYIQNFKILQNAFTKHQVDRLVPVEALIKCKMQDNLEFLQWSKRYWDQYYPGGDYDALARRKASGGPSMSGPAAPAPRAGGSAGARRPGAAPAPAAPRTRTPGGSGGGNAQMQKLNDELRETVGGLERERDFYFSKLRDIELLIQQQMEAEPELEKEEGGILKQIQTILYSTEEGFEIPQEMEGEVEEETF